MTQHLQFVGQMAFQSIGFHTALILNRLRNDRRINECTREDDERSRSQDEEERQAREQLAVVKKRLALLSARVREEGSS
jgi:hypothetical protein